MSVWPLARGAAAKKSFPGLVFKWLLLPNDDPLSRLHVLAHHACPAAAIDHLDAVRFRRLAQAEMRLQRRATAIARPAMNLPGADELILRIDTDLGANAVGVALGADGLD